MAPLVNTPTMETRIQIIGNRQLVIVASTLFDTLTVALQLGKVCILGLLKRLHLREYASISKAFSRQEEGKV